MAELAQIRGAILEEIILILLENADYRILDKNDGQEVRRGHSGLELLGRGEWHQVDALVSYDFTPSFLYPIRLIVEAKAYLPNSSNRGRVGINVVRNAVGVLKDVNENYFSYSLGSQGIYFKLRRFNYSYAIFSLYGFTENAQRYAIAHQIFLIQYYFNPLFERTKQLISQLREWALFTSGEIELKQFREYVRMFLKGNINDLQDFLSSEGQQIINEIKEELSTIGGSYFGLLNGEYPIHLVSKIPLSQIREDEIRARIHIQEAKYVSLQFNNNILYFELPESIGAIFSKIWGDKIRIAKTKREYISYITLTGKIDDIRRNLIIKLDTEWLENYLRRIKP